MVSLVSDDFRSHLMINHGHYVKQGGSGGNGRTAMVRGVSEKVASLITLTNIRE